jgi:integrase
MASVRKRTWGDGKTAWIVDYVSANGRERKHFPTKKAADAFRISIEGQLVAGTYRSDASKVTLAQAAESFLAHCEGRHRRDERMTRKMVTVRDWQNEDIRLLASPAAAPAPRAAMPPHR